jgi:hypothetical protein
MATFSSGRRAPGQGGRVVAVVRLDGGQLAQRTDLGRGVADPLGQRQGLLAGGPRFWPVRLAYVLGLAHQHPRPGGITDIGRHEFQRRPQVRGRIRLAALIAQRGPRLQQQGRPHGLGGRVDLLQRR